MAAAPTLPARSARAAVAMTTTAAVPSRAAVAVAAESTAVTTLTRWTRAARITRGGRCRKLFLRRRRKERFARESDLARVRLDAHDLNLDLVSQLKEIGHLAHARMRHLGDMQQPVLTREDLDERSVRLDALDGAFVV